MTLLVLDPPSTLSWLLGCVVMLSGVVLPIGYMVWKNRTMPASTMHYS